MIVRRIAVAVAAAGVIGAGLLAAPATAAPPHDGGSGHTHHVHTGNGECVDIDRVLFSADHRGLHMGAEASGMLQGPWHGTCSGLIFPGGPPLPPFVPHEH